MKKIFFAILILSSCGKSSSVQIHKYFSLENYFKEKSVQFSSIKAGLAKTIYKDQKSEQKFFENPKWKEEFAPFAACDINKAAYINSYKSDTLTEKGKTIIRYSSIEEKLPVREINITFIKNQVVAISIIKETSNIYYTVHENLQFGTTGYTISGGQEVRFIEPVRYSVTGKFIF
jgi:hypothetical protein